MMSWSRLEGAVQRGVPREVRRRTMRPWTGVPSLLCAAMLLAGCAAPLQRAAAPSASEGPTPSTSARAYSSSSFTVPFDVTLSSWVAPEPKEEQPDFVTWDGEDDTALRVMHPVEVYRPGETGPSAVPADFLDYLRKQSAVGVHLADEAQVQAGPYPATLVTVTASNSVNGSIGCPAKGLDAEDCFGPQIELTLRLAVLRVRGQLILVWLRDAAEGKALAADSASFVSMIAGMRFPDRPAAS